MERVIRPWRIAQLATHHQDNWAQSVNCLGCQPNLLHPRVMHKLTDPHPVMTRLAIQMRPRSHRVARGGAEERACWLLANHSPGRFSRRGIALRELIEHRLPKDIAPSAYPLASLSYLLSARHDTILQLSAYPPTYV